jgi:DeoR family transcriptional regulator, suf operon transcriptional repressor
MERAMLIRMAPLRLHNQFFETTRGRVVGILRRGAATVDEVAKAMGVTENAVRVQLAAMERDGLVRRGTQRRGVTRPANVYELTPQVEQLLSQAYIPMLRELMRLFATRLPASEFTAVLREAGHDLGVQLAPRARGRSFANNVAAASAILNEDFGALTEVEKPNGHYIIRGHGCPLSAISDKHPAVCSSIESFLGTLLGARVKECCDRTERPRCCFEVHPPPAGRATARRAR